MDRVHVVDTHQVPRALPAAIRDASYYGLLRLYRCQYNLSDAKKIDSSQIVTARNKTDDENKEKPISFIEEATLTEARPLSDKNGRTKTLPCQGRVGGFLGASESVAVFLSHKRRERREKGKSDPKARSSRIPVGGLRERSPFYPRDDVCEDRPTPILRSNKLFAPMPACPSACFLACLPRKLKKGPFYLQLAVNREDPSVFLAVLPAGTRPRCVVMPSVQSRRAARVRRGPVNSPQLLLPPYRRATPPTSAPPPLPFATFRCRFFFSPVSRT